MEIQAIDRVELYEDVVPSLSECNKMGVRTLIASSLSGPAVAHFVEKVLACRCLLGGVEPGQRRRCQDRAACSCDGGCIL